MVSSVISRFTTGVPTVVRRRAINLLTLNALRLSPEFANLVREGYSQDSFYVDKVEWTKDCRIEAITWYFWRLDGQCVPGKSEFRLRLITKFHERSSVGHIGVASTLASSHDRFWWNRIRQDVKEFCERCVLCQRANI
jgi:hypothetical protein